MSSEPSSILYALMARPWPCLNNLTSAAGVDQGRANIARHGLIMTIKNSLTDSSITYSMPAFRGGGGFGPSGADSATPPIEPVQRAVGRASQQVCFGVDMAGWTKARVWLLRKSHKLNRKATSWGSDLLAAILCAWQTADVDGDPDPHRRGFTAVCSAGLAAGAAAQCSRCQHARAHGAHAASAEDAAGRVACQVRDDCCASDGCCAHADCLFCLRWGPLVDLLPAGSKRMHVHIAMTCRTTNNCGLLQGLQPFWRCAPSLVST